MQAFVLTENEQDNKLILSPIGIIPTGQGAISVSENGVITLGVDNGTIEIVDNVLTLKGFNSAINGAKLTKTENGLEWITEDNSSVNLDDLNQELTSIKEILGAPSSVDDGGNEIPASGVYEILDSKANKDEVYTKAETSSLIDEKIAAIDHLKRKVIPGLAVIDFSSSDVDQYIYMVPNSSGNYDEYMVVDGELEKVGDWTVSLDNYVTTEILQNEIDRATAAESEINSKLNNIETTLSEKVDIVYYTIVNEDGETVSVPGTLLSPAEKDILSSIKLGENGNLEISKKVHVNDIEGLATWVAEYGSEHLENLSESNLSDDLISQINFITKVDENNFSVEQGELKLNKIGYDKLPEDLASKISKEDLADLEESVTELQNTINGYYDENDEPVIGLVESVAKLNTKVGNLEQITGTLVSNITFNTTVQNLTDLINNNKNDITDLTQRVNFIENQLTWEELAIANQEEINNG